MAMALHTLADHLAFENVEGCEASAGFGSFRQSTERWRGPAGRAIPSDRSLVVLSGRQGEAGRTSLDRVLLTHVDFVWLSFFGADAADLVARYGLRDA